MSHFKMHLWTLNDKWHVRKYFLSLTHTHTHTQNLKTFKMFSRTQVVIKFKLTFKHFNEFAPKNKNVAHVLNWPSVTSWLHLLSSFAWFVAPCVVVTKNNNTGRTDHFNNNNNNVWLWWSMLPRSLWQASTWTEDQHYRLRLFTSDHFWNNFFCFL